LHELDLAGTVVLMNLQIPYKLKVAACCLTNWKVLPDSAVI